MITLDLPELCLVALVGPSGCGKTTFARRFFKPTEILSSDVCRAWVSDDELDQTVSGEAFEVLYTIAAKRLALGKLTVVDATNVQKEARAEVVAMARKYHVLPVAIVLAMDERTCHERNAARTDRVLPSHVIRNQHRMLRASLGNLAKEGFRQIYVLRTPREVESVTMSRSPLWTNKKHLTGPFDIIGDVHGCADELEEILRKLKYETYYRPKLDDHPWSQVTWFHPDNRMAVFLGDIVDRGPRNLDALNIVRNMVVAGSALCVPGNHDVKLNRKLRGKNVQIKHGLAATLAELEKPPYNQQTFHCDVAAFLESLVSHYVLDGGKLVVAHAGMKEELQGRASGAVREFAYYGETSGETDEFGLPVRYNWAADYRGQATVVYGHTPVLKPEWLNRTVCIDTGCVFGGSLTALRWPEREFVSVPAKQTYCEPSRPLTAPSQFTSQQDLDRVLDMDDVLGKRRVETRLRGGVGIRPENAAAALEVMSRFAVDPRWLVYLPPTMSPVATSTLPGFLEHPAEAFGYYREAGVERVICEEKHMGSRAVVVVCRSEEDARTRFGVEAGVGVIVTRTGRSFFADAAIEAAMLARVRDAITAAGLWEELATSWMVLDCELMPWSAKAQELLKAQYAAVGAAGTASVAATIEQLAKVEQRLPGATPLLDTFRERQTAMAKFVSAYRHYCWPVNALDDYKLAPFHVLASEGAVHIAKPHTWHMETLAKFADGAMIIATPHRLVELSDPASIDAATAWWLTLTNAGGEGMVVKPLEFIATNDRGLVQPAVKCRGREYLRIIYGPDYDAPANLDRLRHRGLGRKRALALSEFALGIEALERFVNREPLRRVHECVFGVLALESEPVDPRL